MVVVSKVALVAVACVAVAFAAVATTLHDIGKYINVY